MRKQGHVEEDQVGRFVIMSGEVGYAMVIKYFDISLRYFLNRNNIRSLLNSYTFVLRSTAQ